MTMPDHPEAQSLFQAARKLHQEGKVGAAAEGYLNLLQLEPNHPHGNYLLGEAYLQMNRLEDARLQLQKATEIRPTHSPSWTALGTAFLRLAETGDAIRSYRQALELNPKAKFPAQALVRLLGEEEEFSAAEKLYWAALEKNPFDNKALHHLIHCLWRGGGENDPKKFTQAKELAEVALQRDPKSAYARLSMANIWMQASCPALALPEYEHAIKLCPNDPHSRGSYIFTLNYAEDRTSAEIFAAHRKWSELNEPVLEMKPGDFPNTPNPERRLRIGYVSPDLALHPVAYFFKPVLEAHDPRKVELFLYSNRSENEPRPDITKAFQKTAQHWRWTKNMSDAELAAQVRTDEIDILVDLAGHSAGNRLLAFTLRPAPIQITWLGYPNTTGMRHIDYRFSDGIVEPPGAADALSSEEIVRLPDGFHTYEMPYEFPDPTPPPCLKNKTITFGSFNNLNKVGPRTVELWAKLLHRVPHSNLLLKHRSLQVLANRETLISRFAMHGIQPQRLILRNRTPSILNHISCYSEIDIALDPVAYNGTTTTCEALLMGVPVLTLLGKSHASRVSASLLHRIGLDGWIARDEEHFLTIGSQAAQATENLIQLRKQLRQVFLDSPLSDGPALAGHIEDAYRAMWQRWCSDSNEQFAREHSEKTKTPSLETSKL